MMMILPLRYTHIGRYFRVVAEYTLNSPTRGLKHRTTSFLTLDIADELGILELLHKARHRTSTKRSRPPS